MRGFLHFAFVSPAAIFEETKGIVESYVLHGARRLGIAFSSSSEKAGACEYGNEISGSTIIRGIS